MGKESTPPYKRCDAVVAQDDAVIDLALVEIRLDDSPSLVVHCHAEHRESAILVLLLEVDEPRDLDLARTAPGRPEIQEDDFPL